MRSTIPETDRRKVNRRRAVSADSIHSVDGVSGRAPAAERREQHDRRVNGVTSSIRIKARMTDGSRQSPEAIALSMVDALTDSLRWESQQKAS